MALGLEVTFADDHIFFPANHLSLIGGSFGGTLAASAIQDADPATAPPEIRTVSGETLVSAACGPAAVLPGRRTTSKQRVRVSAREGQQPVP